MQPLKKSHTLQDVEKNLRTQIQSKTLVAFISRFATLTHRIIAIEMYGTLPKSGIFMLTASAIEYIRVDIALVRWFNVLIRIEVRLENVCWMEQEARRFPLPHDASF